MPISCSGPLWGRLKTTATISLRITESRGENASFMLTRLVRISWESYGLKFRLTHPSHIGCVNVLIKGNRSKTMRVLVDFEVAWE